MAWIFLAGVVAGAPVVCLVGASYVTTLTGGGRLVRAGIAAVLLVLVLLLALGGVRVGVAAQLGLVAVLVTVVVVAVTGSASHARAASWTPFAPHGWGAVGHGRLDADAVVRRLGGRGAADRALRQTRAASCRGSSSPPSS